MKNTFLLLFFTASGFMYAQQAQQKVGTNPTVISPSAVLEIESTTKGFLPPRMTANQRDAIVSPAKGLLIYNSTANRLETNTGTPSAPVWTASEDISNYLPLAGGTMTGDINGAALTLNNNAGANTTTIGGGSTTGSVTIGGTEAQTINIATGTAANLVQLGASNSQVAVGGAPVDASAALAVNSTAKGFLPPRLTTAQRDALTSPAPGLTIYNTTSNALEVNTGTAAVPVWLSTTAQGGGIYDGSGTLSGNTTVTGGSNTLAITSDVTNGFSVDGTTFSVDAANNRVGIGTATPTRALDVNGDAAINTVRVGLGNSNIASNTVLGNGALDANTTGTQNTAVGQGALAANTMGSQNTAIGRSTLLANSTGSLNTAVGLSSLAANTTGSGNTAVGQFALLGNTTASDNSALGVNALMNNTTGGSNVAMGRSSLYNNTIGSANVAIGQHAGFNFNTTVAGAGYNTFLGYRSGRDLTTGTGNVFLGGGNTAAYIGTGITTGSNNVVIGNNVTGLAAATSNNIVIADGAGNRRINVDATGNVGINTTTPVATLTVNGSVSGTSAYQNLSDIRYKKDVQPISNALDKVLALNGVTFNWDKSKTEMNLDDKNHIGVLAQDVEQVLPQVVNTANDANKTKSVAYGDIVPVLIEAIKEQQIIIEALQKEVKLLKEKVK